MTQAARLTMENYAAHEYRYVSSDTLQPVYAVLSSAIEADIYLSDNKGNILIMAHTTEGTVPQSVPQAVLDSLSKTGSYQGLRGHGRHRGRPPSTPWPPPVVDENGLLVGAVMATARAANRALAGDMLQMFLIAAIVVLVVSFIVIYFVTTSLVNPCGRWRRYPCLR